MTLLKNFLWFFYKCFAFYTLVVYALILWTPWDGWLAGFMMMSFPAVIVVHILSVPIWFVVEKKKVLLPLALLLIGCIFIPRTFGFGKLSRVEPLAQHTFTVMNYNTHVFMKNSAPARHPRVKKELDEMKKWVANSGADVLCMPEYLEDDSGFFDIGKKLAKAGYKYSSRFTASTHVGLNYYWGLILFSKYPIVSSRDTIFESQNGMVQADIKIHEDTVRVIGLHLYSMTLNLDKFAAKSKMREIKSEGKLTLDRMKAGFIHRSQELKVLESWIGDSPYPVVVCGDFNEVPYGYVYGKLKKTLNNSFEEKGKGFGFTYNHIPYFIRIDHQFYTPDNLHILGFKTFNEIKYSDHYPIMGTYSF